MRVVEAIQELQNKVIKLTERYCENCQEGDCDYCPFELERREHEHTD